MYKRTIALGIALMALAGCGVEVYDYPSGMNFNPNSGFGYDYDYEHSDDYGYATPRPTVTPTIKPTVAPTATPTPAPAYNRNPIITSLTANPLSVVESGDPITFNVDVIDEDHDTLKYTWSATGGVLSSTTGRLVSWSPPARPGVYTVLVSISDGRGGTAEGALNLIVKSNGSTAVSGLAAITN